FTWSLPDANGGAPLLRHGHGYLARPHGKPPAGGWPAVVSFNGHYSSARGTMNPDHILYWYGDAFARRGFVVLALDIGHRPVADRATLYKDFSAGDDPGHGNGPHPAIESPGMDSDWEEYGERTWDAERAVDYILTLPEVNPSRIIATGLSMGGMEAL